MKVDFFHTICLLDNFKPNYFRGRVANKAVGNQLYRNDSEINLKFGSAHRRSHQRAHSAHTELLTPEKKRDLSAMDGFAKRLKEQFKVYTDKNV